MKAADTSVDKTKSELLRILLRDATTHSMSPRERWLQRVSWAFGNVNVHNSAITREMVEQEATRLYGPCPPEHEEGGGNSMTESIYNNAGVPSEQGAAPEIPEDLRKDHAQILRMRAKGVTLPWFGNDKQIELIERIAALTLERDTLKAERDDALRKSSRGVWRCFHCDEVFDTPGGARNHFGAAQGDTPGCLLKVQLGDERGWLMELRKEQEASEQQLQRALNAEREVETLECRVASLSSDMKTIKPFAKCDSMRDVFNVYDSMEGRALAAEEQVGALKAKVERLSAPIRDAEYIKYVHLMTYQGQSRLAVGLRDIETLLSARASTPHPINDDEQRRKDAAWNDRPKARCACGEMIAWYSGEYLHVAGRSKSCADGRLASPAHFLVGVPPA